MVNSILDSGRGMCGCTPNILVVLSCLKLVSVVDELCLSWLFYEFLHFFVIDIFLFFFNNAVTSAVGGLKVGISGIAEGNMIFSNYFFW